MHCVRSTFFIFFLTFIQSVFASGTLYIIRPANFVGSAVRTDYTVNDIPVGGVTNKSYLKLELKPGTYSLSAAFKGLGGNKATPLDIEVNEGEILYVSQTWSTPKNIKYQKEKYGEKFPIHLATIPADEGLEALGKTKPSKRQLVSSSQAYDLIAPTKAFEQTVSNAAPVVASGLVASAAINTEDWHIVGFSQVVFQIPKSWSNVSNPSIPQSATFSDASTGAYASVTSLDASYLNIKDYHATLLGIYKSPTFQLINQKLDIAAGKSIITYTMNANGVNVESSQVNLIKNNLLFSLTAGCDPAKGFSEGLQMITNSLRLGTGGDNVVSVGGNNLLSSYSTGSYTNERENVKTYYNDLYSLTSTTNSSESKVEQPELDEVPVEIEDTNLKKFKNEFPNLKYRRSSVYTLMLNDPGREQNNVVVNTFGNATIPEKFNDHNLGEYLIPIAGVMPDAEPIVTQYLRNNEIAKKLVAKWFNRTADGSFDMQLIAERGQYDATSLDVALADASARGRAMLSDAGEELIKNTFVIVNDYKFTNKEEVAKKAKKIMAWANVAGSMVGVDLDNVTAIANTAVTVAGKGYVIKSDTYLYRLEWNEEVANQFYTNYWQSGENPDAVKAGNFISSDIFKLKYVGKQSAWSDVQSTIFTNKEESELIEIATMKASDKAISKLQRLYPEFQTKTPLYSSEPALTAKIGLKEGLEPRDKFEVLEQVLNDDGSTSYKRKGIIVVEKNAIWDNRYMASEEAEAQGISNSRDKTVFKGNSSGLYPGMLLRQIN